LVFLLLTDSGNIFGMPFDKIPSMRFMQILLFLILTFSQGEADPPEIDSTSPDKAWIVTARWVEGGTSREGYDWDLRNVKTGKVFFHENITPDDVLPRRFKVDWTSDSRYAALTLSYGRALQGINVVFVGGAKPESLDALDDIKTPVEDTLVHSEDLKLFSGYNRLLTGADHWINNSELSIGIEMVAGLEDKKSGEKFTLSTSWHKIVRFEGASSKVIESTCDRYDKQPVKDSR
jgi:hypothetical protein